MCLHSSLPDGKSDLLIVSWLTPFYWQFKRPAMTDGALHLLLGLELHLCCRAHSDFRLDLSVNLKRLMAQLRLWLRESFLLLSSNKARWLCWAESYFIPNVQASLPMQDLLPQTWCKQTAPWQARLLASSTVLLFVLPSACQFFVIVQEWKL